MLHAFLSALLDCWRGDSDDFTTTTENAEWIFNICRLECIVTTSAVL
jgi:hypothetical protein